MPLSPGNSLEQLGAELYARIDIDHPGRGTTDYPGNTVDDIPKSYAMVLLAELDRLDVEPGGARKNLAPAAGRWLLDHADENGDGVAGWGVPVAWDAFGDGSLNPAHAEYTISTAIVIDALLTWSERDPDAPSQEIQAAVERAVAPYLSAEMRTPAGMAPYSLLVADRPYDTFNPAAYLAGQLQRFSRKVRDPKAQAKLRAVADATMQALLVHKQLSPVNSRWYWNYSVQEKVPNDLPHAGYVIDGIRTYMAHGGRLSDQFDRYAVLGHLRDFPQQGVTVRAWPSFRTDVDAPARSYDLGFATYLACTEPSLADLRKTLLDSMPSYRNAQGQFAKHPVAAPGQPLLVVAEYEAYLYRGVMACRKAIREAAGRMAGPTRTMRPADASRRLFDRDAVAAKQQSAAVALLGSPSGPVSFDAGFKASLFHTSGVLRFSEAGVPLQVLQGPKAHYVLFRRFPSDQLSLEKFGLDARLECSVAIRHSDAANPILRAAAIHGDALFAVYFHNPTSANWLVRWPLQGACVGAQSAPVRLPSLEDPAGLTYEMIPSLRFLADGDRLHLVGGTLEGLVTAAGLQAQRIPGCRHIVESVATAHGLAHLCVGAPSSAAGSSRMTVVAPQGVRVPTLDDSLGVPWGLAWSGGQLQIDHASSAQQLRTLFLRDFLATQNAGWFELGINNEEGRIPWSQIYYLNGLLDLLELSRSSADAYRVFGPVIGEVRQRLDFEIALLDAHYLQGRFSTRAFTVDRSPALFAVQTARLLLLFKRYGKDVPDALALASFKLLKRDVLSLRNHIEVLARSGEQEHWMPPGQAHLRWPKGSKFSFDGLPVPFNHQNEWAYAVAETAAGEQDAIPLRAAQDIVEHFVRRVAPQGRLPADGVWDYWWGRAYDGWTQADSISENKPAYIGDKGKAWISFRTIDAMALMAASRHLDPAVQENAIRSASALTSQGLLYPLANQSLLPVTGQLHLSIPVAQEYARLSSPWELANVVWSLARLAPAMTP